MKLIAKKSLKGTTYQCTCCGKEYDELPLCFGSEFPHYYFTVPPEEREKRIEKTESLCVIDGEHFFHRGRLTIPINDHEEDLIFNVWTTISRDNFIKRNELWNSANRMKEEPYFGWLQTSVPTYGNTLNIKTIAIENEVGLIPAIVVIEEGHALKTDQENGISFEKALAIAGSILTEDHKKTNS